MASFTQEYWHPLPRNGWHPLGRNIHYTKECVIKALTYDDNGSENEEKFTCSPPKVQDAIEKYLTGKGKITHFEPNIIEPEIQDMIDKIRNLNK
ncbi:MAG TPA: hypothetical protein VD908_00820 [Cytophagales bacterium]|nr:hypothetical protein [Cytophagales bacterium]